MENSIKKLSKKLVCSVIVIASFVSNVQAQMGIGTASPNSNAMLDVDVSTLGTKKGFLPPRMTTTERTTLGGVMGVTEASMLVYDTTVSAYYFWDGTQWVLIQSGSNATGTMYIDTSVAESRTNLSTNTRTKVDCTTLTENLISFTDDSGTDNRLLYTGTVTKTFLVNCTFSAYNDDDDDRNFEFFIYKNGTTLLPSSVITAKNLDDGANNNRNEQFSLTSTVSLSTNDYIELWVRNTENGDDVYVYEMTVTVY